MNQRDTRNDFFISSNASNETPLERGRGFAPTGMMDYWNAGKMGSRKMCGRGN
jgi:hypothetical protein